MVKYYEQLKNKKLLDRTPQNCCSNVHKKKGKCLNLTIIIQNDDAN